MKLLLSEISSEGVSSLLPSFHQLSETDHKDGKYRLRKYSVVRVSGDDNQVSVSEGHRMLLKRRPHRDFIQSAQYNKFQGDETRSFEDIDQSVFDSVGMREVFQAFKRAKNLPDGQRIEVHQMRVVTYDEEFPDGTPVAPEGVHQDGYNYIAMVGVSRHNITGGALQIFTSEDSDVPVMERELADGEMIIVNDDELWHNATSISRIDTEEVGYGDWFVLCANAGDNV